MAYDLEGVFIRVKNALIEAPRTSLCEVSYRLGVERHTIEKAVRAHTGRAFRNLRNDIALDAAVAQLCSQPNRSIKEISYDCGYESPRAFSRFIRSSCGFAPNELRKRAHARPGMAAT